MRKLLLLVLLPLCLSAQTAWKPLGEHISLGAIAGTNLTDDARNYTNTFVALQSGEIFTSVLKPGPRRLIAGATIELQLPKHFSIEFDALYRPISIRSTSTISSNTLQLLMGPAANSDHFRTWEYPLLFKRRFTLAGVHPFVAAGPSFRSHLNSAYSRFGAVAGAGVEFQWGHLKIAPTVRYTHWGDQTGASLYRQNQSEMLVGFSF